MRHGRTSPDTVRPDRMVYSSAMHTTGSIIIS
jgi:hypothetical protein